MLLSEIGDKEIVDLSKGSNHGKLWDAEILFDETNGKISALLVPNINTKLKFINNQNLIELPWSSILKIGEDMIIFKS